MGGDLRTGQYIPDALEKSADYRAVPATLANSMGHPIDTFGEGESSGLADPIIA